MFSVSRRTDNAERHPSRLAATCAETTQATASNAIAAIIATPAGHDFSCEP
jgi:hypothetical protein